MAQSNVDWQRALDGMIERHGRPATLSRVQGSTTTSATLLVFMRGYAATELSEGGGIVQGDSQVIMSSTHLAASGWPASAGPPRSGDRLKPSSSSTSGPFPNDKTRNIQSVAVRPMDVGWDMHVKG